jgi:glycolate oxidase
MGGGMSLSGLTLPLKGGIVLDLRRMNRILEVNEKSMYAVIEAGVTQGQLKSYLEKHHPHLQHPMPDSPPGTTIAGNVLIYGSGSLSQKYGLHSEMVNGLEVVLPTGEICKIGSCAASKYWHTKASLPDLTGLFIGWFGVTGIVTKLSIRLYPSPAKRDFLIFDVKGLDSIPDAISRLVQTEAAEDVLLTSQEVPEWIKGRVLLVSYITAQSEEELEYKKKSVIEALKEHADHLEALPSDFKERFLSRPQFVEWVADIRKGGGFVYVGGFMPLEKIPEAFRRTEEICHKYGFPYTTSFRVVGKGVVLFFPPFPFNRADKTDVEKAIEAWHETDELILDLGGTPWKPDVHVQKMIMQRMDKSTLRLMDRIKRLLDPNGIMNPGNWEME